MLTRRRKHGVLIVLTCILVVVLTTVVRVVLDVFTHHTTTQAVVRNNNELPSPEHKHAIPTRDLQEAIPSSEDYAEEDPEENQDQILLTPRTEWHKYYKIIRYNIRNKLNHSKYTKFVDKLQFKEYCRMKGIRTVKTLACYDQSVYATIPFDSFGGDFAIKSNKGSKRNIFIRGNFSNYNVSIIRKEISGWGADFSKMYTWEPQYEFTAPKIFIEPLLSPTPPELKATMYINNISFVGVKYGSLPFFHLDADFNYLNLTRHEWLNTEPDHLEVIDKLRSDQLNDQYREMIDKLANDTLLHDLIVYRIDMYHYNHTLFANEITLTESGGDQHIALKGQYSRRGGERRKRRRKRNSDGQNGFFDLVEV